MKIIAECIGQAAQRQAARPGIIVPHHKSQIVNHQSHIMSNQQPSPNYNILAIVSGFVGVSAIGGGIYGMLGAKGTPLELLEGSIFSNYFIPSLILFLVVGGSSLLTMTMILKAKKHARRVAILTGVIILIWIVFQLQIIGYESWLQPFIAIAGISILILAGNLSKTEQVNSSEKNIQAF